MLFQQNPMKFLKFSSQSLLLQSRRKVEQHQIEYIRHLKKLTEGIRSLWMHFLLQKIKN